VFRPATADDLPAIDRLEHAAFEGPWSTPIYREEIRRSARREDRSAVELCVDEGRVVGLSCVWFVVDECHLLRIATHPDVRRQGLGTRLLERVIARARERRCTVVNLEVASQNRAAVQLYARAGFREVGRRPGYYRRPPDDALLMSLDLRHG
jgi:ribosomal-protein-alanine acetyltransferase